MKRKKRRVLLSISAALLAALTVLFFVLNTPERAFRRRLTRELPEYAELVNYTYYFKGVYLNHGYEFICAEEDLDELIKHLGYSKSMLAEYSDDPEIIREEAEAEGVPEGKYWLDTEKETVVGWSIGLVSSRYILTRDTDGRYHVYYEWSWYPTQAFTK